MNLFIIFDGFSQWCTKNCMKINNTKSGTKRNHHRKRVNRRKSCESCSMWETRKRERNFTKCFRVLCLPFLCFQSILATLFDQYDKTIIWNVSSQTIYFLCCTISKLHAFIHYMPAQLTQMPHRMSNTWTVRQLNHWPRLFTWMHFMRTSILDSRRWQ